MGGKSIPGVPIPICEIDPTMDTVITGGIVFAKEMVVFNSGSMMVKLMITDKRDSIMVKTFVGEKKWNEINDLVSEGDYIKVLGKPGIDIYEGNELTISVDRIEKGEVEKRQDNYPGKHRVELHCHTKMSRMDGLNDVDMLQAVKYGYAMANANPSVKEAAPFEAPANTEYGVMTTLLEMFS